MKLNERHGFMTLLMMRKANKTKKRLCSRYSANANLKRKSAREKETKQRDVEEIGTNKNWVAAGLLHRYITY